MFYDYIRMIIHISYYSKEGDTAMDQERSHLSSLRGTNNEKFQKIQEIYEQYYTFNDESVFSQLINMTDEVYVRQIRNILKQNGCYSDESEHTAMQEARIAIWERIRRCQESGESDAEFTRYCKGIYRHKAMDVVRKQNTYKTRYGNKQAGGPAYLDAPLPDGRKTYGDMFEDKQSSPETVLDLEEQREFFNRLFLLYCKSLVNSTAEPPRELALFYARILPHVLHINHEEKTIPDKKMASAKWAFERMKDKTINTLGERSESEMKQLISHTLSWCENFWTKLDQAVLIDAEKVILKDVVYTSVYDKGKIEDWSESMHKAVVKATLKEVLKDQKLVESATEYISDRDKIYCLVKGGKTK